MGKKHRMRRKRAVRKHSSGFSRTAVLAIVALALGGLATAGSISGTVANRTDVVQEEDVTTPDIPTNTSVHVTADEAFTMPSTAAPADGVDTGDISSHATASAPSASAHFLEYNPSYTSYPTPTSTSSTDDDLPTTATPATTAGEAPPRTLEMLDIPVQTTGDAGDSALPHFTYPHEHVTNDTATTANDAQATQALDAFTNAIAEDGLGDLTGQSAAHIGDMLEDAGMPPATATDIAQYLQDDLVKVADLSAVAAAATEARQGDPMDAWTDYYAGLLADDTVSHGSAAAADVAAYIADASLAMGENTDTALAITAAFNADDDSVMATYFAQRAEDMAAAAPGTEAGSSDPVLFALAEMGVTSEEAVEVAQNAMELNNAIDEIVTNDAQNGDNIETFDSVIAELQGLVIALPNDAAAAYINDIAEVIRAIADGSFDVAEGEARIQETIDAIGVAMYIAGTAPVADPPSSEAWYADVVYDALDTGLMNGQQETLTDGTVVAMADPAGELNVAQTLQILANIDESVTVNEPDDGQTLQDIVTNLNADDQALFEALPAWAQNEEVAEVIASYEQNTNDQSMADVFEQETSGNVIVDAAVDRAAMVNSIAEVFGDDLGEPDPNAQDTTNFSDVEDGSQLATNAALLDQLNIVNGESGEGSTALGADMEFNRAQAFAVAVRTRDALLAILAH